MGGCFWRKLVNFCWNYCIYFVEFSLSSKFHHGVKLHGFMSIPFPVPDLSKILYIRDLTRNSKIENPPSGFEPISANWFELTVSNFGIFLHKECLINSNGRSMIVFFKYFRKFKFYAKSFTRNQNYEICRDSGFNLIDVLATLSDI